MPLWQMGFYGGVMVLAVLALRALLGKRLPKRVMPVLWALVLARLLVPFSISSPLTPPIPGFLEDLRRDWYGASALVTVSQDGEVLMSGSWGTGAAEPGGEAAAVEAGDGGSLPLWDLAYNTREWIPRIAGAGAAATALVMLWRYCRDRRRLQGVYPVEDSPLVGEALEKCGVRAWVYTCDTIPSPMAVGVLGPRILLPASMDFENRELVGHILTHEAMHIRRRDNLLKLLMAAALCLHWYNPLVWLMARGLCRGVESACDEAALAVLGEGEREPYARSLVRAAVPGLPGGLFASAFSPSEVERRVKGVLAYRKRGLLALTASAVLILTAATAFATVGQTFFDSELGSWCGAGDYIAKASLNRPIDLGGSREYARSRANAAVLEVLEEGAGAGDEELAAEIAGSLAREFGVEPSAFQVEVAYSPSREKLEEEYRAYGLVPQGEGWSYQGQAVHRLEDPDAGVYFSQPGGEVDVYVLRDEAHAVTSVEAYLYFRF